MTQNFVVHRCGETNWHWRSLITCPLIHLHNPGGTHLLQFSAISGQNVQLGLPLFILYPAFIKIAQHILNSQLVFALPRGQSGAGGAGWRRHRQPALPGPGTVSLFY